jgi:hypothetical protein
VRGRHVEPWSTFALWLISSPQHVWAPPDQAGAAADAGVVVQQRTLALSCSSGSRGTRRSEIDRPPAVGGLRRDPGDDQPRVRRGVGQVDGPAVYDRR